MKSIRFATFLPLVLLVALTSFGQSFRGALRGEVKDASGASIAGATISARNVQTALIRTDTTSADGSYVISELPSGSYEVTATGANLQPVRLAAKVDVGADTALDFTLGKVAQVEQTVEVQANSSLLDPTQAHSRR